MAVKAIGDLISVQDFNQIEKGPVSMTIEPTRVTPQVYLDAERGILSFKGRSSPSASLEFYYPIMSGIDRLFAAGSMSLTANFAMEYFNTSSSKCLFDILKRLAQFEAQGVDVEINWFYEEADEDMKETGEDFEELIGMEFNYIEIEEY